MKRGEKVALFDFCGTLANFQTADPFVDYVRLHSKRFAVLFYKQLHRLLCLLRIIKILTDLFPQKSINKRIYALQLRGFSYKELDQMAYGYYLDIVRPNLIERTLDELIRRQNEGWRIVIVSGGYDFYIKYFAMEYGIILKDIICTSFKFKDGICTGLFEGKDCLFTEKVNRLNNYMKEYQRNSVAYSDSNSDTPFLSWASVGYVVRNSQTESWDADGLFEEIVV